MNLATGENAFCLEHPMMQELLQIKDATSFSQIKELLLVQTEKATSILEKKGSSTLIEIRSEVPTLLVSDIHGRRDYIWDIINYQIDGKSVIELLEQNAINLVFFGDGMHTEDPYDWIDENIEKQLLSSFGTMMMIQKLMQYDQVYYLTGNHDDINGVVTKYGDNQNLLIKQALIYFAMEDFIEKYVEFERKLPFLVYNNLFVASHAAPKGPYTRSFLVNRTDQLKNALTTLDNTKIGVEPGCFSDAVTQKHIQFILEELGLTKNIRWFIGHRHVKKGNYRIQCNHLLIQFNDQHRHMACLVNPLHSRSVDPDLDIFELPKG